MTKSLDSNFVPTLLVLDMDKKKWLHLPYTLKNTSFLWTFSCCMNYDGVLTVVGKQTKKEGNSIYAAYRVPLR
jgi:hypothetical protein